MLQLNLRLKLELLVGVMLLLKSLILSLCPPGIIQCFFSVYRLWLVQKRLRRHASLPNTQLCCCDWILHGNLHNYYIVTVVCYVCTYFYITLYLLLYCYYIFNILYYNY